MRNVYRPDLIGVSSLEAQCHWQQLLQFCGPQTLLSSQLLLTAIRESVQEILSAFARVSLLPLVGANSHFGNIPVDFWWWCWCESLLLHLNWDYKLPMWNIQSGLLWETCFRTNISSHTSVSLWCIAAFLLVYLSMRLQDTFTSKSFGFFNRRAVSSLWTLENHFFFHTVTFVYFVCYECPTVNKLESQENSGIEYEYFHHSVISTKYQMMYGV